MLNESHTFKTLFFFGGGRKNDFHSNIERKFNLNKFSKTEIEKPTNLVGNKVKTYFNSAIISEMCLLINCSNLTTDVIFCHFNA